MSKLTPEQRQELLAQTQRVANHGLGPEGPVTEFKSAPAAPVSEAVFSAEDLLQPVTAAEPFLMPNGKRVWVHPLSVDQVVWLNAQAVRDVARLPITDEQERQLQRIFRAQCYQVVCACRVGPEPGARQVFQAEHAEALRRNPGYAEVVAQICALCDRLGQQEDPQRELFASFFGEMELWLATCCSRLSEGSSDVRTELERFAACVSRLKLRKQLAPEDLACFHPEE